MSVKKFPLAFWLSEKRTSALSQFILFFSPLLEQEMVSSSTTVISAILWMVSFVLIMYSYLYGNDQTIYEFQSRGRRGQLILPNQNDYGYDDDDYGYDDDDYGYDDDDYDSFDSEEEPVSAESNWPITGLGV